MELIPHPSSPPLVTTVTAEIDQVGPDLRIAYRLGGDLATLVIPVPAEPVRTDELWRTTCFELFVRGEGLSYCEFNFSPSGQWAAYAFDSYRSGARELDLATPPRVTVETTPTGLILTATLERGVADGARIGLSAVIEGSRGDIAYWALAHPPGPPDFHHDACFALHPAAIAAR